MSTLIVEELSDSLELSTGISEEVLMLRYSNHDNLPTINSLDPACCSCGTKANLSSCADCELLFTCDVHWESFERHKYLCRMIQLAEKSLETWRWRYHDMIGEDPHKYSARRGDAMERNTIFQHNKEQCHEPKCQDFDEEWFSLSDREWELSYADDTWCPARLCSFFYDRALESAFIATLQLADEYASGPALRKALLRGVDMLRQGLSRVMPPRHSDYQFLFEDLPNGQDDIWEESNFFMLALRFSITDDVEELCHTYMYVQLFCFELHSCMWEKRTTGIYPWNAMDEETLAAIGLNTLEEAAGFNNYQDGATGYDHDQYEAKEYDNRDKKTRIFRYFNSPLHKDHVRVSTQMLIPRIAAGPNSWESLWELQGQHVLFVLTLRAIADLQAIQMLPQICGTILPLELYSHIQYYLGANPIVLRDQSIMSALTHGHDLTPFIDLLREIAGTRLDWLERRRLFEFSGTPLPLLQPFEKKTDSAAILLYANISKIPCTRGFLRDHYRKAYPRTMAESLDKRSCNVRKLLDLISEERKQYLHQNPTTREMLRARMWAYDRTVERERAAAVLPQRTRRGSESSLNEKGLCSCVRHGDPINMSLGTTRYKEGRDRFNVLQDMEVSFYYHNEKDVRLTSWSWLSQQNEMRQRVRSMSFDSHAAATRVGQLQEAEACPRARYAWIVLRGSQRNKLIEKMDKMMDKEVDKIRNLWKDKEIIDSEKKVRDVPRYGFKQMVSLLWNYYTWKRPRSK